MKVTIEQVEKLQQRANVSYEEAKSALENCDGDILEALIMLEKEGKTEKPGQGQYSTQNDSGQSNTYQNNNYQDSNSGTGPNMNYNGNQNQNRSEFGDQMNSLWKSICNLFHKGNINHFVVAKDGREVMSVPVNILILLIIIFNMAALIIMIVLLFLGYKYHFKGPDLGKDSINNVMDAASDTADDLKSSVKDGTSNTNTQNQQNAGQNDPNSNGNNQND